MESLNLYFSRLNIYCSEVILKKFLALLLSFIFLLPVVGLFPAAAIDEDSASYLNFTDELTLYASSCYLVSLDTGRVVYEYNANERVAPASTTKIMSAALALSLTDDPSTTIVTLPEDLWAEFNGIDISHAGLSGNEELTMEQLVHCMLLQSANEAASGVASYFGRESFIEMMNQKAKSLGCTNTNFTNPHGLYDPNHYTSAKDLYLITKWALTVPGFYEIVQKSRYEIPETNKNYEKMLVTSLQMQDSSKRYYTSYIKGVKTGTLDESGRCLVSTAEKNNMRFCLVLLGCPLENNNVFWEDGSSVYSETRIIYDWMFANSSIKEVVTKEIIVTQIPVNYSSKKDNLVLYSGGSLSALLNRNNKVAPKLTYDLDIPESIDAPIEKGQKIGTAKVYADDIYIGDISLVSFEDVDFNWFLFAMAKAWSALTSRISLIIIGSVIALFLLYFLYLLLIVRGAKKRNR